MRNSERGTRSAELQTVASVAKRPPLRVPSSALRACLILAIFFTSPFGVIAQDNPGPRLLSVRVGFESSYKLGCWTPVELAYLGGRESRTGLVTFTVPDGDGVPVVYASQPIQLTPGRTTAVVLYVRFGRYGDDAKVAFTALGENPVENRLETRTERDPLSLPYPLADDDRLIVCLGPLPTLAEVAGNLDLPRNRSLVIAQVTDPRRLPTRWQGYESADAVVLAPEKPESFAALAADAAPLTALHRWLELGGRLATVVSLDAQPLFAAGGALREFAGGEVGPSAPLPRTTELEKLAGSDIKQAIAAAALRKTPLDVPRLSTVDGDVTAREGDLPLVVRRAAGLGSNLVFSFSPEHPLLASWSGRQAIVRQLLVQLGVLTEAEAKTKTGSGGSANFGYGDLAGQLRAALDQYEGVQVISFFTLAVMVLAYLALIGPVDYLLVRKVFKRPELTWITFPTIVLLTSVGAYYLAVHLKGEQLRVNQADVVDCDAATGTVRGTSWAGVFSPVGRSYDVKFSGTAQVAKAAEAEQITGWLGLPGFGLGGMHNGGGASWFAQPYLSTDGGAALTDVPIQVWSSKMFAGRSAAQASQKWHEPLAIGLDRRLAGTLRNPFPFTLEDAFLFWRGRAFDLGDLPQGETRELSRLDVRDLQAVLQDWKVALSANKNPVHIGQPHDPGSQDVAEILRKMMFFAAAGGEDHARLENRFQAYLDLSPLLTLHRAVLVARIDPAQVGALQLTYHGRETPGRVDQHTAFLRLVIPVAESSSPSSPAPSPAP